MAYWSEGMTILLDKDDMVTHVVGSSPHKPPPGNNGSWKQFWENETGKIWPEKCRIYDCLEFATVGAHIYVKDEGQYNFILPACQGCNMWRGSQYPKYISVKHNSRAAWVERHPN